MRASRSEVETEIRVSGRGGTGSESGKLLKVKTEVKRENIKEEYKRGSQCLRQKTVHLYLTLKEKSR